MAAVDTSNNNMQGCKDYDVLNTAHPKPSKDAQSKVTGAHRLIGTDIYAKSEQRPLLNLETKEIPPHVGSALHLLLWRRHLRTLERHLST